MLRKLAQLGTIVILLGSQSRGEVITLTEYRSACSATYTSSTSTKTVTVTSTTNAASSTPFVIRIDRPDFPYILGLPAPIYLAANAEGVQSKEDAAEFKLADQTLILVHSGGLVGTLDILNPILFPSFPIGYESKIRRAAAITTAFEIIDDTLQWNNDAFDNGSAVWYISDATADGIPRLHASFAGQIEAGDVQVSLAIVDAVAISTTGTSSGNTASSTTSASGGNTMASGAISSGTAPTSTNPVDSSPGLTVTVSSTSTIDSSSDRSDSSTPTAPGDQSSAVSSMSMSSSRSPLSDTSKASSTILSLTSDSIASTITTSSTSATSNFLSGDSSSVTSMATATSSTSDFVSSSIIASTSITTSDSLPEPESSGISDVSISSNYPITTVTDTSISTEVIENTPYSSNVISSRTSFAATYTTTSVLDMTSTTPVYTPTGTPVIGEPAECPVDSNREVQDRNGIYYQLACSYDSDPDAYRSAAAPYGFNDCFGLCDNTTNCSGFTYVGQVDGIGAGVCYFKSGRVTVVSGAPNFIAAFRLSTGTGVDGMYPDLEWPSVITSSLSTTSSASSTRMSTVSSLMSDVESSHVQPSMIETSSLSSTVTAGSSSGTITDSTDTTTDVDSTSSPTAVTFFPSTSSSFAVAATSTDKVTDRTSLPNPASSFETSVTGSANDFPSSTSTSYTTTSTITSATVSSVYTNCPEADGLTQYDPFGNGYTVYCGFDSDFVAFQTVYVIENSDFTSCFKYCSNFTECVAFTFETTICYLKAGLGNLVASNPAFAYAIRIPAGSAGSITTTSVESTTGTASTGASSSSTSSTTSLGSSGITFTSTSSRYSTSSTTSTTRSSTISFTPGEPTACTFGDPKKTQDDTACQVELPFEMQIFDRNDYRTYASVNGFVSLSNYTDAYDAASLPTTNLPVGAALPLFDDMYLDPNRAGQNESISYTLTSTSVTYNFTLSKPGNWEQYIFSVYYSIDSPGTFVYRYETVGGEQARGLLVDEGRTAIVGVQGGSGGQRVAVTYSYEEAVIVSGLTVTCDTLLGLCRGSDGRSRP